MEWSNTYRFIPMCKVLKRIEKDVDFDLAKAIRCLRAIRVGCEKSSPMLKLVPLNFGLLEGRDSLVLNC